jgi:hypothetical protein
MKLQAAFVILLLVGGTCAQEGEDKIFWGIFRAFCDGVPHGKSCRFPHALTRDVESVCCRGLCHFGTDDCRFPMDEGKSHEIYELFQRYVCREQEDGRGCVIPASINKEFGYKLKGTCCDGLCHYGSTECIICGDGVCSKEERRDGMCTQDCTDEYLREERPRRDDMSLEEQMESVRYFSCVDSEDGSECSIEEDLKEAFNLGGVCCGGECHFRKTTCPIEQVNKPDLIVSSIQTKPDTPKADEKVHVTVTVENVGKAPVKGGFWIALQIFDGDTLLTEDNFNIKKTLIQGEKFSHTFHDKLGVGREGSFRIKADADMNSNFDHQSNLIDEADEGNNGGAKVIYVQAPEEEEVGDVCGDGYCSDLEESEESCPEDCRMPEGGDGPRSDELIALLAVVFGIAVVAAIIVFLIRSKKRITTTGEAATTKSVEELQKEKEELEKMMAIAKAKYHKRELDEESFREIIRDNQKKVIELELKIKTYRQ